MIINKKPYIIERQAFPFIKEIQWSHVEQQRLMEEWQGIEETRGDTNLLTECGYSEPGLLNDVLNEMMKYGYNSLHIYYSKLKEAKTGGKHADGLDVLIVQSYGRMKYIIDDDEKNIALFLPTERFKKENKLVVWNDSRSMI